MKAWVNPLNDKNLSEVKDGKWKKYVFSNIPEFAGGVWIKCTYAEIFTAPFKFRQYLRFCYNPQMPLLYFRNAKMEKEVLDATFWKIFGAKYKDYSVTDAAKAWINNLFSGVGVDKELDNIGQELISRADFWTVAGEGFSDYFQIWSRSNIKDFLAAFPNWNQAGLDAAFNKAASKLDNFHGAPIGSFTGNYYVDQFGFCWVEIRANMLREIDCNYWIRHDTIKYPGWGSGTSNPAIQAAIDANTDIISQMRKNENNKVSSFLKKPRVWAGIGLASLLMFNEE